MKLKTILLTSALLGTLGVSSAFGDAQKLHFGVSNVGSETLNLVDLKLVNAANSKQVLQESTRQSLPPNDGHGTTVYESIISGFQQQTGATEIQAVLSINGTICFKTSPTDTDYSIQSILNNPSKTEIDVNITEQNGKISCDQKS